MGRLLIFATIFILLTAPTYAFEYKTVPAREGVEARYYLEQPAKKTSTLVILLPGGNGAGHIKFTNRNQPKFSINFLTRTFEHYLKAGIAVAIFDTPTDHIDGVSDSYRKSEEQVKDVLAIVEDVNYPRIFILTTSRSGISAGNLATNLRDKRVKGVVFTNTVQCDGFVCDNDLSKVNNPTLFLHHPEDVCKITRVEGAHEIHKKIMKSNPDSTFIELPGGDAPWGEDPCEPKSFHGFWGNEEAANTKIIKWISTH